MKTDQHFWEKRLKQLLGIGTLGIATVAFAGCSNSGYHERRGTAAGAATGAVIGGIVGHQSGEEGEGAAIGAAAGALVGREVGRRQDDADYPDSDPNEDDAVIGGDVDDAIDYGELMTDAEKERVRERSGESFISDWGDYLTARERSRLRERADVSVGG